jgi:hypothetical protein
MITPTLLTALLVFFGIVGLGLVLKRILPAGTTLHLPKYVLVGLVSVGAILLVLLTIIIVVLVLNR